MRIWSNVRYFITADHSMFGDSANSLITAATTTMTTTVATQRP